MHSCAYEWPAAQIWVFLNGERLYQCREACEEGGWAVCYEADSEGRHIVNHERPGARTFVRYGIIHLQLAKDATGASWRRYQEKRHGTHQCSGPEVQWPAGYKEWPCLFP
jgi:hypothetical protein